MAEYVPKKTVLEFDDEMLKKCYKSLTGDDVSSIPAKKLRSITEETYSPAIELRIIQPFPLWFGLDENRLRPDKAFLTWLKNKKLVIAGFSALAGGSYIYFEKILRQYMSIACPGTLHFILYNHRELLTLKEEFPYLRSIAKFSLEDIEEDENESSSEEDSSSSGNSLEELKFQARKAQHKPIFAEIGNSCKALKLLPYSSWCKKDAKQNRETKEYLARCIQSSKRYIILHIAIYFRGRKFERKFLKADELTSLDSHASAVFIDMGVSSDQPVIIYSLESSWNTNENYNYAIRAGIESYVQNLLPHRELKYMSYSLDACPRFSIQQQDDFCATWSLYLMLLMIHNPGISRSKLMNALSSYSPNDRYKLLLRFVYFLYTIGALDIEYGKEDINFDYPKTFFEGLW